MSQLSCGLGGNFGMDWVATFLRIGWQNSVEYAGLGFEMLDSFEGHGALRRFDRLEPQLRHCRGHPITPHELTGFAAPFRTRQK